jgi:hypothetical protein
MDENLAEGVTASLCQNQMTLSTVHKTMVPHVVHWLRTQSTVIMALNNSSVQVTISSVQHFGREKVSAQKFHAGILDD